MNPKYRIGWQAVMALMAIIPMVAACGGSGSEFSYKATGTAAEARVTYAGADGTIQEETVSLPWEMRFEIDDDFEFDIRVSNNQPAREIGCEAWLDDRKLGDAHHEAYVACTGKVYLDAGNPASFIHWTVESDLSDAESLLEKGELDNALDKVQAAIDDAPHFARGYYVLGKVHREMGEPAKALAAYDQAIALDPEFIGSYHNRGWTYLSMGEFEPAIADFSSTIELDPDYAHGYYNRAVAYARMGDNEASMADALLVQEFTDDPVLLGWVEELLTYLDESN